MIKTSFCFGRPETSYRSLHIMTRGQLYFSCAVLLAAIEFAVMLFCLIPCRQSLQKTEDAAFTALPFQNHEIFTIDEPSSSSGSTTSNNHRPVRFLWGIMSTLRPKDAIRRDVIRRTYLSYDSDRICSLSEANQKANSCQILYTFVVGANPNAPMDLVDYKNVSWSEDRIPCRACLLVRRF